MKHSLADFDYPLPPELIAQSPAPGRSGSRLLHLSDGEIADRQFTDLPALLAPGDLLILNDTRVIKARLHGAKASGGKVEVLVERLLGGNVALAQVRASKSPPAGSTLKLGGDLQAKVLGREGEFFKLEFAGVAHLAEALEAQGELPLPPYIAHPADRTDEERYQTVYAREPGAVAAPTAGLHFDAAMFEALAARGVNRAFVTLHVGAGTFQPVRTEDLSQHHMHSERYWIPQETVDAVAATKAAAGRVVCVGTTSLRAVEANAGVGSGLKAGTGTGENQGGETARKNRGGRTKANAAEGKRKVGLLKAGAAETDLFITPGYRFQVADLLLTNFHLPKSTLLMLVSAFAGMQNIRAAYAHAIAQKYRFFSYGDCMLMDRSSDAV